MRAVVARSTLPIQKCRKAEGVRATFWRSDVDHNHNNNDNNNNNYLLLQQLLLLLLLLLTTTATATATATLQLQLQLQHNYNNNYNYNYNYNNYYNYNYNYATLHYTTQDYTTLHYPTLHYPRPITPLQYGCNYTTLFTLHQNYNSTTLQLRLQLQYTTLNRAVVGEVTTATIATTPTNTNPTTFRSISGFALPSVIHNNQPLL